MASVRFSATWMKTDLQFPAICPLLIFTKPLEELSNTHTHVFVSLTLHDKAAFVPIGFHDKIRIPRHVETGQNIFDKEWDTPFPKECERRGGIGSGVR
jgi:hypothetical protein